MIEGKQQRCLSRICSLLRGVMECRRCGLPAEECGELIKRLYDAAETNFSFCNYDLCMSKVQQFKELIAEIKSNEIIGDHIIGARQIRSRIFRVTSYFDIPMLYLQFIDLFSYLNRSASGWDEESEATEQKKIEIVFEFTNMLLDVCVPYDIPYEAIPSLYHALIRNYNYPSWYLFSKNKILENLYLPNITRWLKEYMIPLPSSILIDTMNYSIPTSLIELFVRAGANQHEIVADNNNINNNNHDKDNNNNNNNDDDNNNNYPVAIDQRYKWYKTSKVGSLVDVNAWNPDCNREQWMSGYVTTRFRKDCVWIRFNGKPWCYGGCFPSESPGIESYNTKTEAIYRICGRTAYQRATYRDEKKINRFQNVQNVPFELFNERMIKGHEHWRRDYNEFMTIVGSSCFPICNPADLTMLIFVYHGQSICSPSFISFLKTIVS